VTIAGLTKAEIRITFAALILYKTHPELSVAITSCGKAKSVDTDHMWTDKYRRKPGVVSARRLSSPQCRVLLLIPVWF